MNIQSTKQLGRDKNTAPNILREAIDRGEVRIGKSIAINPDISLAILEKLRYESLKQIINSSLVNLLLEKKFYYQFWRLYLVRNSNIKPKILRGLSLTKYMNVLLESFLQINSSFNSYELINLNEVNLTPIQSIFITNLIQTSSILYPIK